MQNAKNAGILDWSDKFRDNSISGTLLYGGMAPSIPGHYKNGVKAGTVKYVIMDGGGYDCYGIHPTTAGSIAADAIWAEIQKNNFFGTDTPTSIIGDVNADNNINALDFALMKQYLLGIVTDFPASDDMYAADLNGDGSINALDLALMKQYLLGIITKFQK